MLRLTTRFFLLPCVLAVASSCSDATEAPPSGNEGPRIQAIEGPNEFRIDGEYAKVDLRIAYTDAEGDKPAKLHVKITDIRGTDQTVDLDPAQITVDAVLFTFGLEAKNAKTKYPVQFSLIDTRGAEGTKLIKEITLR